MVHTDHLGTPQVITNNNQAVVWQADYEPFGNMSITTEIITNNLRFPFDALNRLRTTTDAMNGLTAYAYDARDNLTSVTDQTAWTDW